MLSVLQFRLNRRYVQADPPFVAIELDQSDSGREGCAVSTLTITSEPKDWRGAIQVRRCCCLWGFAGRSRPSNNPCTLSRWSRAQCCTS